MAGEDDEQDDPKDELTADPPKRIIPAGLPGLAPPPKGARPKDLLSFYLSEVRRYPLLNPEEERHWAKRLAEAPRCRASMTASASWSWAGVREIVHLGSRRAGGSGAGRRG